jgi:hypothetical protein
MSPSWGFDMGTVRPPISFCAFDLLQLNGKDLKTLPIEDSADIGPRKQKEP